MILDRLMQPTRRVAILVAVVASLALTVAEGERTPAFASGCGYEIDTATSGNTVSNWMNTTITDPTLKLLVTPKYTGVYDNHPIGVWWTGSNWAIFNQDAAPMALGSSFEVKANYTSFGDLFTHVAASANISGNTTLLDDPAANNNPNAIVVVTPNYNPNGGGGVYDNHPIGVYYNGSRWAIFNQDKAAMPTGAAFNVDVLSSSFSAPTFGWYTHTATSGNVTTDYTRLSAPTVDGYVLMLATPNYNPGGIGGAYHNHNIGGWYSPSYHTWTIFNQDVTNMTLGDSFNVMWETC